MQGKIIDLIPELDKEPLKPEYKHLLPVGGIDIICISDANTYLERLVFAGIFDSECNDYSRLHLQIDGCHTFMIHGGDKKTMKSDHTYIRRLAKVNGLEYHINQIK